MHMLIAILLIMLTGCASQEHSALQQGQELFAHQQYTVALPILEKLASKGNAKAQYATGYMYYYGQGVYPNPAIGQLWIRRAAAQGYEPAQKALQLLTR